MLFEVLCTSKSRRLIDSDQEALLSALTRISREAIETKLSDYQRDSWLFLSSLDLESFSFGDRLPLIQNIRIPYYKQGNFALVMDISYSGGIKVGLKAAVAMNFRDFAASINFNPSEFKLILKFDAEPTPRISLMISDLPAYEMSVTMRSQQLDRASNLIKILLGNFIRSRFCYPNYLTVLFPRDNRTAGASSGGPFAQIANSKQFQSQLRVRLVSANLNSELETILPSEELKVMAVLNFGEINCKTEIINAEIRNTRWNSIHTFNIFNGMENSPKILQIVLYQILDSTSMNQLGRIEIPYASITPGLLDIRTLSLSTDATSSISLEMYLHHMEEDGEKDSNWIFWNSAKPPKRKIEQVEQVNWNTLKFIVSKLSSDTSEVEQIFTDEEEEGQDQSNSTSHVTHLFDLIMKLLNKTINRLTKNYSSPQAVDILNAFRLELDDFSIRFNLSRPALSIQALPAHNERIATLLRPLIKSFVPEAVKVLQEEEHENDEREAVQKALRDLTRIQNLVSLAPILDEPTNESSPDLLTQNAPEINLSEFNGFIGDQAVKIVIDDEEGLKITKTESEPEFIFDFEGIFYTTTTAKSFDLGSTDFFNDMATWEVSLLKNRFITFVPLGQSHLFPHRVIDLQEIVEIELIKDRNAFTLGFNADLSTKEALKHANNGVLRLTLRDGEKLDLFGESRSCDQWFCIFSSRIQKEEDFKTIQWKDLNKIWLLPLNLPFLTCPYALALRQDSLTHLIISSDIYRAYCKVKTTWLSKREFLGFDFYKNSSTSSLNSSPSQSQKSQKSKSSFNFSFSASNSSLSLRQDPFSSKSKYDRLTMSQIGKFKTSESMIFMSSIEDLKEKRNKSQWTFSITEGAAIFNCSISNLPSGYISIGPEFICYWTAAASSLNSVTGLPLQNQNILLLPRHAILEISKTLPNWVSSFSGIVLRLKKEFHRQGDPIILTGFENNQELELVYDYLYGIN